MKNLEELIKKHYPNYDLNYKYRDHTTIPISTVKAIIADLDSIRVENRVIRFVGGNEPLNVGKLKKIIADLDNDFTIDMRVRTKITDEQLKNLSYPYPYNTEHTQLEFDDIGYSDKQLCLGCEIANKHV